MTASAGQRSKGVPLWPKLAAIRDLAINEPCNRHAGQRPFLAAKSKEGEGRNARATSRADARFWMFPSGNSLSRITAATGSTAIIRQAQELSRFAALTFLESPAPRNTKSCRHCAEPVDDETSLWKTEENLEYFDADPLTLD